MKLDLKSYQNTKGFLNISWNMCTKQKEEKLPVYISVCHKTISYFILFIPLFACKFMNYIKLL